MYIKIFGEPRGIIKIIELIFCICAFAIVTGYHQDLVIHINCYSITIPTTVTTTEQTTSELPTSEQTITTASSTSTPELNESLTSNDLNANQFNPRLPQFVISTTTTPDTEPDFIVYTLPLDYPFRLSEMHIKTVFCHGNERAMKFEDKMSTKAVFYVTTGVVSFLYVIGITVFYLLGNEQYKNHKMVPFIDFLVTVILCIFWFCGSIAWAAGVANFKGAVSLETINFWNPYICYLGRCSVSQAPDFTPLNISVIFGFGTWILFLANCWFVLKETSLLLHTTYPVE